MGELPGHVTTAGTTGSSAHTHHVVPSRAEPRRPEVSVVPSSGGVDDGSGGGGGSCGSGAGSCGSGGPSPRPRSAASCRSDSFITLEEFAALTQRLHEAESQLQVKSTLKVHLH